jgi:hypothetical protein
MRCEIPLSLRERVGVRVKQVPGFPSPNPLPEGEGYGGVADAPTPATPICSSAYRSILPARAAESNSAAR